jgi:hypothetical protein
LRLRDMFRRILHAHSIYQSKDVVNTKPQEPLFYLFYSANLAAF